MAVLTDIGPGVRADRALGDATPCSPLVCSIATLPMADLLSRMTPARAKGALDVLDWLYLPRQGVGPTASIVEALCERLIAAGVPLDRYGSSTSMVTSEHDAVGRLWRRGEGVEDFVYVSPADEDPSYRASPFHEAAETRQWVEVWLPGTDNARFEIVATLRAQGFTHYLCIPVWLSNGENGWITFATRQAAGFTVDDLMTIAFVVRPLAARIDSGVGWTTLDKLLRTYVGDEPHTAILAGRAKRGQVSTIEAAMMVADLRDSTGHTAEITTVEAVQLFNDLFDCLVPGVESRHGEVLKYLGDGLLAMFRDTETGEGACDRALDAAEAALAAIAAFNGSHPAHRPLEVGIALHYGTIAYGNVGSGARLDFTVIGRDVGLATRIAGMNAALHQPLLLSAPFAARLGRPAERIGAYAARGFQEPVEVFRPAPTTAAAVSRDASQD